MSRRRASRRTSDERASTASSSGAHSAAHPNLFNDQVRMDCLPRRYLPEGSLDKRYAELPEKARRRPQGLEHSR
ncbi:hypothetical protein GCM10010276_68260 [Streptomyces longisporus]|uniref:Uncharacterized protein n=1 Tax=Streptomyces longisporus TaxID=1948 RepID=A0ABN3MZE1_STRLO